MSLLAIVGRPNVGKSTLFNRLVGMRQAIVDETAGVTRDRHYGKCAWCGCEFSVVDTGGYTSNSDDVFEEEIRKQVMLAVEEKDLSSLTLSRVLAGLSLVYIFYVFSTFEHVTMTANAVIFFAGMTGYALIAAWRSKKGTGAA